jgi:hypothetical protein
MLLALFSVAVVWVLATLAIVGVFAATSFDDFGDLVRAAMRAAVPAVWFVPAVLFLQGSTRLELTFGLMLLALAIRFLVAARPPRRLALKQAKAGRKRENDPFFFQTLPIIGGALLLQSGAIAAASRKPAAAGVLVALGSALIAFWWTSASVRHALPSRRSIAGTVFLALVLTAVQFRVRTTPAAASSPPKPSVVPLVGGVKPTELKPLPGKDLVPGVILRPPAKPQKIEAIGLVPASRHGILESRPFVLNFTGEYHLFPTSSGHVQADSTVLKGTPLDAAYASMSGGTIETEALQPLNPPLDLTNCGTIQLSLKTGERSPASATLQLLTPGGSQDLGTEIFGLDSAGQETLEFAVPGVPANLLVKAIRIVFHRDPFNRTQSTKVAVQNFTFLPRF